MEGRKSTFDTTTLPSAPSESPKASQTPLQPVNAARSIGIPRELLGIRSTNGFQNPKQPSPSVALQTQPGQLSSNVQQISLQAWARQIYEERQEKHELELIEQNLRQQLENSNNWNTYHHDILDRVKMQHEQQLQQQFDDSTQEAESQIARLKSEHSETLNQQQQQHDEQVVNLRQMLDGLTQGTNDRIADLRKTLRRQQEEHEATTSARERSHQRSLDRQLRACTDEINNINDCASVTRRLLQMSLEEARKHEGWLQIALNATEKECGSLAEETARFQTELQAKREENRALTDAKFEVDQMCKKERADARNAANDNLKALFGVRTERDNSKKQCKELQQERKKLEAQKKKAEDALHAEKQFVTEHIEKEQRLVNDVSQLREQCQSLTESLDTAHTKLEAWDNWLCNAPVATRSINEQIWKKHGLRLLAPPLSPKEGANVVEKDMPDSSLGGKRFLSPLTSGHHDGTSFSRGVTPGGFSTTSTEHENAERHDEVVDGESSTVHNEKVDGDEGEATTLATDTSHQAAHPSPRTTQTQLTGGNTEPILTYSQSTSPSVPSFGSDASLNTSQPSPDVVYPEQRTYDALTKSKRTHPTDWSLKPPTGPRYTGTYGGSAEKRKREASSAGHHFRAPPTARGWDCYRPGESW